MDLKILEIASNTENHKVLKIIHINQRTKTPYVVMKWKLV